MGYVEALHDEGGHMPRTVEEFERRAETVLPDRHPLVFHAQRKLVLFKTCRVAVARLREPCIEDPPEIRSRFIRDRTP